MRNEVLPAFDRLCQRSAFVQGQEAQAFERESAARTS
jgi:hypothetical protein